MQLTSSAFSNNGLIPQKYTCDDIDVSPPLHWTDPPENTKSFTLICDDPDSPSGDWSHWVVWNIPANCRGLSENIPKISSVADSAQQGTNDYRRIGYSGPCPPSGKHRYFFRLFALDTFLNLDATTSKDEVLDEIKGHVLAKAELMGKYSRK
ncbi:YbhB/YbcL family Raf kinase inhibitor-like protein [Candidatus Margulisiibacteriota bacterium]